MQNKQLNSKVDAYISNAAPFAQPILKHFRKLIHQACPSVTEVIKWGFPNFEYHNAPLCHFAAFKQHCAFGFWKAALLNNEQLKANAATETAMGHLGKIKCLENLPPDDELLALLHQAMLLNENGIKVPKKSSSPKPLMAIPDFLLKALQNNPNAQAYFEQLSTSHKNEYIEWLMDAKTVTTQTKRLAQTIEWLNEKKHRNWKYS